MSSRASFPDTMIMLVAFVTGLAVATAVLPYNTLLSGSRRFMTPPGPSGNLTRCPPSDAGSFT